MNAPEGRSQLGHSQAQKAISRERILDTAAQQIRENGLESVSIAELMKSAKLTHGGFYGHFASRSSLIAEALGRAIEHGEAKFTAARSTKLPSTIKSIVNRYLSPTHRADLGGGCAIGALAGDVARSDDEEIRALMTKQLEVNFKQVGKVLGDDAAAENAAMAVWCTMVGAITLSRVFQGTKRADEILKNARQSILDLEANLADSRSKDNTRSR